MKKIIYISFSLSLISLNFCYEADHYVIKKPGEPAPLDTIKRSLRPLEQYSNLQIQEQDVIAQERFKISKEIELEGRIPYQESKKTVITPTAGSVSNQ